MTCLHLHSSLFPLHAKLKLQQQHHIGMENTTKLLWGVEPSRTNPHCKNFSSASSLRTKAIQDFIVVAATSPPKPGDLATFLPVSALLLTFYFISNFIVPDILTKYYGFDKVNEDKVDDVEDK
ncbi:uncharacterized protein LOC131615795 [Vicia villosa]|uniref:uncharacterized protein LOC131615795 n=1 Tax=Vicia villosa TaxID=3911 RepID=UPI00273C2095|nr:uncharacterized protein LOC131615795 [Vicia villosa]